MNRNRVVDLLRAVAILTVVLGHWLIAAVMVRDGRLSVDAVLNLATWSHPLTWVFQVMPVFFLVGGYANACSWRSARRRQESYAVWLAARLRRLGTPVVPLLLVWLLGVTVGYAAGAPVALLRTASQVALVPTWFLAAYVLVVAVAPLTLRIWERTGWVSVVGGLALGGLVDWWSIGGGNTWVGFVNYLVVWATVHQLGYAWLDGRLAGTSSRLVLAGVGAVGLVVLVGFGPYPVSMIGIDGAVLNNSYPTRVTLGFLGLLQGGLLLALEPMLARWLERPGPWRFTGLVNLRIMTLYLWHVTVAVAVVGLLWWAGGLGLHATPLSFAWWAGRPVWWLVLGVGTVGVIRLLGRFESPGPAPDRRPPAWLPFVAVVALCGGLGTMAAQGMVTAHGVQWVWPVAAIGSVLALRPRARGRGPVSGRRAPGRRSDRHESPATATRR